MGSAWPAGEEGRCLQPAPKVHVCPSESQFRLVDSKFLFGWFICIPGVSATGVGGVGGGFLRGIVRVSAGMGKMEQAGGSLV